MYSQESLADDVYCCCASRQLWLMPVFVKKFLRDAARSANCSGFIDQLFWSAAFILSIRPGHTVTCELIHAMCSVMRGHSLADLISGYMLSHACIYTDRLHLM